MRKVVKDLTDSFWKKAITKLGNFFFATDTNPSELVITPSVAKSYAKLHFLHILSKEG